MIVLNALLPLVGPPCPFRLLPKCSARKNMNHDLFSQSRYQLIDKFKTGWSRNLLRKRCGNVREQGGSPIPTTTNQAYLQRDVVVEVKEVVWILGRQPIWRQMKCDSLSHQENTWARFVCQGSSAAVVQQGLKHETQPMRQPVMSFAPAKFFSWLKRL